MEESTTAPTGTTDGQGAVNAAAPAGDETGGQGAGEPTPGQFGGFDTPEELATAYETQGGELTTSKEQYDNLRTLDGRRSTEVGQLRTQNATLTGQIEGMKTAAPAAVAAPTGPTIDAIAKQLDAGEIDESTAIRMSYKSATQEVETKLGAKFQGMLQTEIGKIQQQTAHDRYVEKFMTDNPGYKEAYETGKLELWTSQGMPGEEAWDKFQLQAKDTEIQTLKETAEEAAKAAGLDGLNKGIKIEQGKTAAGKVLTGKGGSQFSATTGKHDLGDPLGRHQAGVELIQNMRGG